MAEGVLFDLVGKLLEGLASLVAEELGIAWGFKEEVNKLARTASAIRAVLRDAEDQRNSNNHQVTHWLKELKDALYDVDDLLDEFFTDALRRKTMTGNGMVKEVRLFFSKSNKFTNSFKMGHRVKDITDILDSIAADRAKFKLSDRPLELPLVVRERDQTHSFVRAEEIIGRDDDKKKIVELLLEAEPEQNVSIVPIIGIGGLGKTTLAKLVFNNDKIEDNFDLKMWVCVSVKFELKVIVENLIEAATKKRPEKDLQLETLQDRLRRVVNGKKYLLVLDDVWNEDLERWLGLKTLLLDGAKGSWIVVTTRSEVVARITYTASPHVLQGLSKSESWFLLKQMAFKEKNRESNASRLEAIGMEIVEQCKGVPLALRAIGRVLYEKAEAEWVKVKNNVHRYINQPASGIMPILKLSYDHLPMHLKQCFAYCSLIPKDTEFEVKKMIRYWVAQGFVEPSSGDDDLEDMGHECFMDLLWRSFFQVAEKDDDSGNVKSFTMHDLMHDLACSVAGSEYCIGNSKAEYVNKRTRHVSVEDIPYTTWKIPTTLLKATRVRSLLLINRPPLDLSTWSVLLSNFKYLRSLDLSFSGIMRLPNSIGELKHLRDFDFSGNYNIRELPSSLSKLQNLQILDLYYCQGLEKLPSKTSRLVSLMHLDIRYCDRLGCMPRGLGQLTCLRSLYKFVVGKTGRDVGELRELEGLNNLKRELDVLRLRNAGFPEPGSTYLKDKPNLKSLLLSWCFTSGEDDAINEDYVKDEMVFECLEPHPNLEKLKVSEYPGSKISSWLSGMTNLTQLCLERCYNCTYLPPLDKLSSLKMLNLIGFYVLANVSETEMQKELSCVESTTIFLPSLKEIIILSCTILRGWWREYDVGETSNAQLPCFPSLSDLTIEDCPNLTSMPLFPSIKKLNLRTTSSKPLQETMKMKRTASELAPSSSSSSSSSSTFPPFSKLETLDLREINDLVYMPSLHQSFSLNFLKLSTLEALENAPEVEMQKELFSAKSTAIFFPSLKELSIHDCPNFKGWWRPGDVGETSNVPLPCFPSLSDLTIEDCPNLISMPLFPSVQILNLKNTSSKPLQLTMKMKRTTSSGLAPSSTSSTFLPFSNLETLGLDKIEDLDCMPSLHHLSSLRVVELRSLKALEHISGAEMQMELSAEETTIFFPSLEKLCIDDCPNLKGWWRAGDIGEASNAELPCFACLSELYVERCPNITSPMPLFPSARNLYLTETKWKPVILPTMKMTTSQFAPFSKLETLHLKMIEDLDSLPEELLQNLTSLFVLDIEECINLTSMPEGMHHLTSLSLLSIADCPQLTERCQRDIGVDWPNIAHIQSIVIDGQYILY